jgi:hypothetical protein
VLLIYDLLKAPRRLPIAVTQAQPEPEPEPEPA